MKISYNWLKDYINVDIEIGEISDLLTSIGLEVESVDNLKDSEHNLDGVVVGEVKFKEKHPDADKLSLTKVDIGTGILLEIVCGAPNVEVGQKVLVATIGTTIGKGENSFKIKKAKIRGALSEGMICAEDELGLGNSHSGIMVLESSALIGQKAVDYLKLSEDVVFTIGLTPNRSDAASHIGVARDLLAVLKVRKSLNINLTIPSVDDFKFDNNNKSIDIIVEDKESCKRYSGLVITDVKIGDSPEWMVKRLKAIGVRPINNIVDIANYVMFETGQPLHSFDLEKLTGNKVIVKKLGKGTKFLTLDGVERELSGEDLMICNAKEGMCIAGVFGGIDSGISNETKSVFLESACFNPVTIRKTSKFHALNTDSSFRFERGTDADMTVYAIKRAAMLIKEFAGGTISSDVIDIYPEIIEDALVKVNYANVDRLIGKSIDRRMILNIIESLGMKVIDSNDAGLIVIVPKFKADVKREVDIIEEILRIYGYNNIELTSDLISSISFTPEPDKDKIQNVISDYLSANGFYEIYCNSLTNSKSANIIKSLKSENNVKVLNPVSRDLDIMRQTMLSGGLETILYNQNRKAFDLKMYEFGYTYHYLDSQAQNDYNVLKSFTEKAHLTLLICGKKNRDVWKFKDENLDFFDLKYYLNNLLNRCGIDLAVIKQLNVSCHLFSYGLSYIVDNNCLVEFGKLSDSILKYYDIEGDVYYADIDRDLLVQTISGTKSFQDEISKFPEVRRDLALLLDKNVLYQDIENIAYSCGGELLKSVDLFDVYEGDKIPAGKKSYAISFILQDKNRTLIDEEIEQTVKKIAEKLKDKLQAVLR